MVRLLTGVDDNGAGGDGSAVATERDRGLGRLAGEAGREHRAERLLNAGVGAGDSFDAHVGELAGGIETEAQHRLGVDGGQRLLDASGDRIEDRADRRADLVLSGRRGSDTGEIGRLGRPSDRAGAQVGLGDGEIGNSRDGGLVDYDGGVLAAAAVGEDQQQKRPRSHRRRSMQRGFTLVELLTVAAIIAGVTSLGLLMYARIARGDKAPSFARSILALAHEARQIAAASGLKTRLRLSPTGAMTVSSEQYNGTSWVPLNTMTRSAADIEMCTPRPGLILDGTGPNVCPLAGDYFVCFQPNGNSWFDPIAGQSCSGSTPLSTSGSTLYVRTGDATGTGSTTTGAHHYKILIWYLTGMPKLLDTGTNW